MEPGRADLCHASHDEQHSVMNEFMGIMAKMHMIDIESIDVAGFDVMDRKLLLAVMQKFDGGPVGIDNLAAAIGEERGTIEDVIEPYLIQQGYLMRTPRGRQATRSAWLHFGLQVPARPQDLFVGREPDA